MANVYRDDDVNVDVLEGRKIGILGYGNQGRAQGLNLRDSGFTPLVGSRDDEYKIRALEDGFTVRPIREVAAEADVILVLLPDEVQPEVYQEQIQPSLRRGDILCFASGYNIYYQAIVPPEGVGAIMVA